MLLGVGVGCVLLFFVVLSSLGFCVFNSIRFTLKLFIKKTSL